MLASAAIVIAVVVVLFGRVVAHPFIAFDDAELILRNAQVTDPFASWADQFFTPRAGYIVPVTVGVQAALYALSGGDAWSFHAAAVLLHALCAVQLLLFAPRLGARGAPVLFAALAFAVHPLVVQPVAWAICLKDLLMANLVIAGTRSFVDLGDPTRHPDRAGGRALLAMALALLAMLAKPSATLVGFAWLAYLAARRIARQAVPGAALRVGVGVAALGLLVGAASRHAHDAVMGVEVSPDWTPVLPLAVLGRQLRHVLWPNDLAIAYAPPAGGLADFDVGLGALAALAFGALTWRARARPTRALLLALAATIYLPTSNVLPFARIMSDSYMYVPLFAFALLGALACEGLAPASRPAMRACAALAGAALLALGATSHAQLDRWRGGAALWQPVIDASPNHADAHRLLGDEHVFRREPERAVEPYRRYFALHYDARYLVAFGSLLTMTGRVEDAECVNAEAFVLGTDPAHAAHNYAVLLAFHPDYSPRYPAIAKRVLAAFDAMPTTTPGALPRELLARLGPLRARLAAFDAPTAPWRPRTCAILRDR